MPADPGLAQPDAPTRARFGVIYFGIALAVIQYIDRVCISWAMPDIRTSLDIAGPEHDQAIGYVFSAFTLAYALFEIPTGWLGDRFGPRKTLVRVVLWWSFFTAATGWVSGLAALIVVRFLFGMGEAGCFPNLTRAFSMWLPPAEKSRAQSILWLCARWGGALTPVLVWAVLELVSWRTSFGVFACLGLAWAWFFARWFRDEPKDHPSVNAAEWALLADNPPVARHDRVPWRIFLSSRTTWLLWAQYFFFSYCWYFYITWLSKFLKDEYGGSHSKVVLAVLAGVPLLGGGFGNLIAGTLMPHVTRWTGSLRTARRLLACGGFGLAALVFLFPAHHLHEPLVVMAAMGLASLLARPVHDLVLERVHGRGREVRRHLFRGHEHDGQPGGSARPGRGGTPPRLHAPGLGRRLQRLGGRVPPGGPLLALRRPRDAARAGGDHFGMTPPEGAGGGFSAPTHRLSEPELDGPA